MLLKVGMVGRHSVCAASGVLEMFSSLMWVLGCTGVFIKLYTYATYAFLCKCHISIKVFFKRKNGLNLSSDSRSDKCYLAKLLMLLQS